MSKKTRVGVIGTVGITRNVRFPNLNATENIKAVAQSCLCIESAKEKAEKYNIFAVWICTK